MNQQDTSTKLNLTMQHLPVTIPESKFQHLSIKKQNSFINSENHTVYF